MQPPQKPSRDDAVLCPFTIVVDSREQAPYAFNGLEGDARQKYRPLEVPTVTKGLETGDYSILGLESLVAIERKSVEDFFGSIGAGRERFEREMERMAKLQFGAVVIEGDWNKLLFDRPETTQMSGKSASRTIASWSVKYGVHWFPLLSKRHAEIFTYQLLSMFWRHRERQKEAILNAVCEALGAV